ncbi:phosphoadenylyl-sulfate reductase [Dyella mobilis]|uniref:Phosphoadenosine 5'-phosphosulfate reductase n=1 Tax=Dyella mobilis TaxID=1849582 RepID=A0ABS2KDE7_9GAMM|nr:phosphoadenylyl-sulfate reductase [Dyella mobilis]MBM7129119.1 phosphoadenylyl-sulfate reductase [Dyella mobilis]GLQ98413.1 phosphoadenosine phosphosulfate reductase [Dyella mobilis]
MSLPSPELAARDPNTLAKLDAWLLGRTAEERVEWALRELPGAHVLSSSFGAQSAVSLHLLTQQLPSIPVIVVDTGYLFAETYRFIDALTERLSLNLHVVRPALTPAWLEARHGQLWNQGREGIDRYNRLAKVEPMQQALATLEAGTWFAGLRRQQSLSRAATPVLDHRQGRWKMHPIIDWTDRDIGLYLRRHDLPYHPLWDKGYVSIGDTHTTARWEPGMREEDTRFFGIKRECGLHLDV